MANPNLQPPDLNFWDLTAQLNEHFENTAAVRKKPMLNGRNIITLKIHEDSEKEANAQWLQHSYTEDIIRFMRTVRKKPMLNGRNIITLKTS